MEVFGKFLSAERQRSDSSPALKNGSNVSSLLDTLCSIDVLVVL